MAKAKGTEFCRFFLPVLDVLKELGGSGRPAEVTDLVLDNMDISEEAQAATLKNGSSRVRNQVAWARFYLVKAGYLDSSQRGVWSLTDKGRKADSSKLDVLRKFKDLQKTFGGKSEEKPVVTESPSDDESVSGGDDYRSQLLSILCNLPSAGFERICQRLLRESGFQQVQVTGRSGDGGIDGHGILRVNPFVSFKVLFQCKRYKGAVTVAQVRGFLGALMGRVDKGIMLTTGTFTTDAKREATRDGATPIELVDSDSLVEMFEQLELGMRPKRSYDLDYEFFGEYEENSEQIVATDGDTLSGTQAD